MAVGLALPSPSADLWWLCPWWWRGEHLHWGFSFSFHILVPVCCEAWTGHGASSPLFSLLVAGHIFCTYQLQAMTCYQILALLRWADKRKSWECSAYQRCWVFCSSGGLKCKLGGPELCSKGSAFRQKNSMFYPVSLPVFVTVAAAWKPKVSHHLQS